MSNAIKFTGEGGVIVNVYFKENNPTNAAQRNNRAVNSRQILTLKMESTQEIGANSIMGEGPKSQQDTPPPPSSSMLPIAT